MAAITTAVVAGAGVVASASAASKARKQNQQAMDQQREAADRQADIAERQEGRSEEAWQRYRTEFQPIEDQFVQESKNLGSIAKQDEAATQARADVAGAYSQARDGLNRTPGSNPTSQAYLQETNRINLSEATNSAAAQTKARQTQADKGRAALIDSISIGKGLPANASSMLSSAANSNSSAAGMYSGIAAGVRQQGQSDAAATNNFFGALGGLSKNPTVQGWGQTAGNWLSGNTSGEQIYQGGFGTGNAYGNQDLAQFI